MSENNNNASDNTSDNASDNTSVTSDVPPYTEKSSNSSDGNAAVIDNKEFETLKTRMTELSNATLATVAAIDACIKPKDVVANAGGSKKRSSKSRRQNHKSKTTRSRKTRQSQSKR